MIEVPLVEQMDDETFANHLLRRHEADVQASPPDMRVRSTYESLHAYRHRTIRHLHEHRGDDG
jgi:hypothetical protein